MNKLLSPGGCPWDREQTVASLLPYVLEEACEVIDAVENGTPEDHCDELGDLLLQVVFHAALRAGTNDFHIGDVVSAICEKLTRRHPHVFETTSRQIPGSTSTAAEGSAAPTNAKEVLLQWDQIKEKEKKEKPASLLDGIPLALPALVRAQKTSRKAAKVGFDWPDVSQSLAKVREEVAEIEEALSRSDKEHAAQELGDVLFAVCNVARKIDCDAEVELRRATQRFRNRFVFIEKELDSRGTTPKQASLQQMDALWEQAKTKGI